MQLNTLASLKYLLYLCPDGILEAIDDPLREDGVRLQGVPLAAGDPRLGHAVVVGDEVVLVLLALELTHLRPHLVHVPGIK